MAAIHAVFLARDYVSTLDTSAYVATMSERISVDKQRAAERDAQFKRQAQSVADGFARMIADIVREGILEDNLASLRHFALEEFLKQQSSVLWFDREASSIEDSIRDLRNDRQRAIRDLVRDTNEVLENIRWHRDLVVMVRDAYKGGLDALNAIEPKRLTAEDYATVRAIDEVLPALKAMQKDFEKRAKSMNDAGALARNATSDAVASAEVFGPLAGGALLGGLLFAHPAGLGILIGGGVGLLIGMARRAEIFRQGVR